MKSISFLIALFSVLTCYSQSLNMVKLQGENDEELINTTCFEQDKRGNIWIGSFNGLIKFDGVSFVKYDSDLFDSTTLSDDKISKIKLIDSVTLLVGTQRGLNLYDLEHRRFQRITRTSTGIDISNILVFDILVHTNSGNTYISTQNGILFKNPRSVKYEFLNGSLISNSLLLNNTSNEHSVLAINSSGIYDIESTNHKAKLLYNLDGQVIYDAKIFNHNLIICLQGKVIIYDILKGNIKSTIDQHFSDIINSSNNTLFACDGKRVFKIDSTHKIIDEYYYELDRIGIYTLPNHTYLLGGSINKPGISIGDLNENHFKNINAENLDFSSYATYYPAIPVINKEEAYLLSPNGSFTLNLSNNETTTLLEAEFSQAQVLYVSKYGNKTFYGTTDQGIIVYDQESKNYSSLKFDDPQILKNNAIRDFTIDTKGNLWIPTWDNGIIKIDLITNSSRQYQYENNLQILQLDGARLIYESKDGTIWAGTRGGLMKYDHTNDTFYVYTALANNSNSLSEASVFSLYEDANKILWIGTYGGGLNKFNPKEESFTHYTTEDGLPDNNILSIYPDNQNRLWISTFNGISCYIIDDNRFVNFDKHNGLLNNAYAAFIHAQTESGSIVLGGAKGIDYFHPDSVNLTNINPSIQLTKLKLSNETIKVKSSDSSLGQGNYFIDKDIDFLNQITIPYDERIITLEYAAFDPSNPTEINYQYRLLGFDEEWQEVDKTRSATYTNLDPGKYTFQVKAHNQHGLMSTKMKSINLKVEPPWWNTSIARICYLCLGASLLLLIWYYQKKRLYLHSLIKAEQEETKRLLELNEFKTNFYQNISHEFRTPLTIILGFSAQLKNKFNSSLDENTSKLFHGIEYNSHQLLEMINDILDLAKIDFTSIKLSQEHINLNRVLPVWIDATSSIGIDKNISVQFESKNKDVIIWGDRKRLEQVLRNLIGNAIQYSNKNQNITVHLSKSIDHQAKIQVIDAGIGIPKKDIEHIFKRFYQATNNKDKGNKGSGIGLSLSKELVELMNGSLQVSNNEDNGSTFTIYFPLSNKTENDFENSKTTSSFDQLHLDKTPKDLVQSSHRVKILIVEDNRDVRYYYSQLLKTDHFVVEAENGREAYDSTLVEMPDIIITDIMMPIRDGYDLCESLKSNKITKHIPIIMITARADQTSRIKGRKLGADYYLNKPFIEEEFIDIVHNIITLRNSQHEKYRYLTSQEVIQKVKKNRKDDILDHISKKILANLSNEQYGIKELCGDLNISRTQLHMKLKALSGLSTSHFIRSIRLEQAEHLLVDTSLRISEIAYKCGFNSDSFFIKVFKEKHGKTPKDWRNSNTH